MSHCGFEILYEEGPCLAVCKPNGLLTQAPPGIDSLEVRVKQYLKQRDGKPGKTYLGVPHRLDRPASGVLVLGRHVRATRRLSEQFEDRTVNKVYWTVVEGHCTEDEGLWEDYLRKIPDEARAEIVPRGHSEGRAAALRFRTLARLDQRSLLEIELLTGRTHQIRVQASARGHPICGDTQYGAVTSFGPQCDDPRDRWIALHARSLTFRHPTTRSRLSVTARLTPGWTEVGVGDDMQR